MIIAMTIDLPSSVRNSNLYLPKQLVNTAAPSRFSILYGSELIMNCGIFQDITAGNSLMCNGALNAVHVGNRVRICER